MKRLSPTQTRRAIARLGIERSLLETFGLSDVALRHRYAFHRHSRHQLVAPQAGLLMIETADALHLVAPTQAAWIPAGVRHATTIGDAPASSLFFPPARYATPASALRILPTTPLLRELLHTAAGPWKAPRPIHRSLFDLLHHLVLQAQRTPAAPDLPRPHSPGLTRAVDYLLAHLDTATPALLARAAGVSARTLRRHFRDEMRLTPERYIQQARLTKARQLLLQPSRAHTITEIALAVGYQNHSAFTAAFRRLTGQSPTEFRAARS